MGVETSLISRILDVKAGIALDPTFVKLIVWCDHDWGYPRREVDLSGHVVKVDRA